MEGRWVPEEEGGCSHFLQLLRLWQTISMPLGFPAAQFFVRSPKLCFVLLNSMFVVGRKAVNVSGCTNDYVYLTKAKIRREGKAALLHLDPSSVGHPDKR
jgi:hypothetical protein